MGKLKRWKTPNPKLRTPNTELRIILSPISYFQCPTSSPVSRVLCPCPVSYVLLPMSYFLLPLPLKYYQNCIKHDLKINCQTHVLNIEKIIFHALDHLIYIAGVAEFYHAPTGEAGT